jgi:predicted GNAT superfamily acetyltransferase
MLLALGAHGGVVLGALRAQSPGSVGAPVGDGTEMVGFLYGFLARDPGETEVYLLSQSMAIVPELQDAGLGRLLKWAQRERALASGIGVIRWTYDPMRTRNAHLNLDVLGATTSTLLPDHYGTDAGGRDSGVSSDRLLVDWVLDAPRRPAAAPPAGLAPLGERSGEWLTLPADWDGYRARVGAEQAQRVRLTVRAALASAFARGERAVSCRRVDEELAAYRLIHRDIDRY